MFCIAPVELLKSLLSFQINPLLHFTHMPSLISIEKVNCENCGTRTTRLHLARHEKRCSAGSVAFPSSTNFSTKSRAELKYHIAKKHSKASTRVDECKTCDKGFNSFYLLQKNRRKEYGEPKSSGAQKIDVTQLVGYFDDNSISGWILIWRMEDTVATTLPWIIWTGNVCWKSWMLSLISQMCG